MLQRVLTMSLVFALGGAAHADQPGTTVTINSTEAETTIGRVVGRGVATSGGTSASATYTEDVCIAPCSLELEPGLYEIYAYGPNHSAAPFKFEVRDQPISILVDPGSLSRRWLANALSTVGLTGLVLGAVFAATEEDRGPYVGLAAGGFALTAVGVMIHKRTQGSWTIE